MSRSRIKYLLEKKAASPIFDKLFGIGDTGVLPYLLTKAPTAAERKKMLAEDNDGWGTVAPFAADWRLSRARKSLAAEKGGGKGIAKPFSEKVGPVLASLLWTGAGAGIGAGIGAMTGDKGSADSERAKAMVGGVIGDRAKGMSNTQLGAAIGAAGGFGLSMLGEGIGALSALISRRRTEKEQRKYESSGGRTALNYLLPGSGRYNYYKNIGYLQGEKELIDSIGSKNYMSEMDQEFNDAQAEDSEQHTKKKKKKKKEDKKD